MRFTSHAPPFVRFGDLIETISPRGLQIDTLNYGESGTYPIIDQGQRLIVGYTDRPDAVIQELPLVVFGDHTRTVKFIDFPFAVGADGTKLLRSRKADTAYLYYLTEHAASLITNLGYARHFKELREAMVPFFSDAAVQRRIAAILGTWDAAIEKTERVLTAKANRREHWHTTLVVQFDGSPKQLHELITPVHRPVPRPSTPYTAIGIRSHGKGTFHRHISRPEQIDMDTLFVVAARDLIVNITFAWEGAIALAKPEDEGCLVSHRFPTFEINEAVVNRDYFGFAANNARFFYSLRGISPGSAGRNRVLNQKDFLRLSIPYPLKKQQDRIARLLTAADKDIAATVDLIARLKTQKSGLMQRLLTGKIRVPEAVADLSPAAD